MAGIEPTPVSVTLLAKNCFEPLKQCLDSLRPFLRPYDEVIVLDTGSTDNTPSVLTAVNLPCPSRMLIRTDLCRSDMLDLVKKWLPSHHQKCAEDPQFAGGFLRSFAEAREIVTREAKHDVIFWLDSDDILTGGDRLRLSVENFFSDPSRKILFLPYAYSFDTDGTCNTLLWRERLLRKSHYHWKGACHETIVPNDPSDLQVHRVEDEAISIKHAHARHHTFSDIRNYAILREAHEEELKAGWSDPRTEFYLGNACRGLNNWAEAIKWYSQALLRSGSRDDRLTCCLNIAYGYIHFARQWKAIDWFLQATKIWTEEPRAYYGIAKCYFDLRQWQKCLIWTQIGNGMGAPAHITAVDPLSFTFYPKVFEAMALKEMGNLPAALRVAQDLIASRPGFQPAKDLFTELQQTHHNQMVREALLSALGCASSPDAGREIIQRFKPEIRQNIIELHVEPYASKPEKSIAFFCGKTYEPWDGSSMKNGVGGSEKMVIQIAERLARRGWTCDVYGNPKPEHRYKVQSGVAYKPSESFDPKHERDVLVLWRSPALLDVPFKARKILVDMHDVPNPAEFTPDRLSRASGVIFKSNYHRELAPTVPADKAVVLRNAIDLEILDRVLAEPIERNYHKVCWTTSGDRGLRGALITWAHVKNEFPDSEFHIFYGFTPLYLQKASEHSYQYFGDCGCERHMLDYVEECCELQDRLNVVQHGRVSTEDIYRHLRSAGIWLYPTRFPEISCISAMEAQACGAFPLCSDTAALKETVTWGSFVEPADAEKTAAAIRGLMQKGKDYDQYRLDMMADARKRFSLDTLVDEWEKLIA